MTEITLEEALNFAQQSVFRVYGKYLGDLEVNVFKESWANLTYAQMGLKYGYAVEYLNNDVGYHLWKKLSEVLAIKIGRRNFKEILRIKMAESCYQTVPNQNVSYQVGNPDPELLETDVTDARSDVDRDIPDAVDIFPFPEGSEPLNSPFYIEREGVESLCQYTV